MSKDAKDEGTPNLDDTPYSIDDKNGTPFVGRARRWAPARLQRSMISRQWPLQCP